MIYFIILLLISIVVIFISYKAITNTKFLNKIINNLFSITKNKFELEELDISEFKKVLINKIITFHSKVYNIKGLGILSELTANIGIMQILTYCVNPYEKDLPSLNIEIIIFLNNRKVLIEIYDFILNKENNKSKNFLQKIKKINENFDLENIKKNKPWYNSYLFERIFKSGSVKDDEKISNFLKDVMEAYIEYAKDESQINEEEKNRKILLVKEFSEKLIEKGGVAINNFKNSLGKEKTKEYLGKVLYGYLHIKIKNK